MGWFHGGSEIFLGRSSSPILILSPQAKRKVIHSLVLENSDCDLTRFETEVQNSHSILSWMKVRHQFCFRFLLCLLSGTLAILLPPPQLGKELFSCWRGAYDNLLLNWEFPGPLLPLRGSSSESQSKPFSPSLPNLTLDGTHSTLILRREAFLPIVDR